MISVGKKVVPKLVSHGRAHFGEITFVEVQESLSRSLVVLVGFPIVVLRSFLCVPLCSAMFLSSHYIYIYLVRFFRLPVRFGFLTFTLFSFPFLSYKYFRFQS